jgi:hypothetical protein
MPLADASPDSAIGQFVSPLKRRRGQPILQQPGRVNPAPGIG